jgi:uncharacterized protein YunC (DUF1805 family)
LASAGTVTADFEARRAKFASELEKIRRDLGRLKESGSAVEAGFKTLTRAAGALGGVFSTGAILAFAQQAFEAADAIGDAAARAGVGVESLSRLKFAAEQNDVEFASLTKGIREFQKNLSAAAANTTAAQEKLALLGLEAAQLRGIALEDQLALIADRFRLIVDPADQTRIAVELFGKAGQELIPLLNQGSAGIQELTSEADRLGITLSTTTSAGIAAADEALKRLKATVAGFFQRQLGSIALSLLGTDDEAALLELRLQELQTARDRLNQTVVGVGEFSGIVDNSGAIAEINQQIAAVQDQILGRQLEAQLAQTVSAILTNTAQEVSQSLGSLADTAPVVAPTGGGGGDGSRFIDLDPITRNEETLAILSEQTLAALTLDFDNFELFEQLKTDVVRESALDRLQIQEQALAAENALREAVTFNAVNLLNTLGAKNKAFAIAAIAIQKFKAVQETLFASKTAAMLAYASQLVPGDPTSILRAQAAYSKTIALGKINAALIVAGGVLDVANVLSNDRGGIGNTGLGTPSNPLPVIPGGDATGAERGATTIYVSGYIGKDMVDELVRALRDEADRDVVIFPTNSRQAIEIRQGT